MPSLLVAREHHATHPAASQQPDHFISRHGLWTSLKFFAALFTNESELFIGQAFSLMAAAAVCAFDGDNDGPGDGGRFRNIERRRLVHLDLHLENGLPALNS